MNIYVVGYYGQADLGVTFQSNNALEKKTNTENNHEILLDYSTFFFMFISRMIKKS